MHGGTRQLQGLVDRRVSNSARSGLAMPPSIGKILSPRKPQGPKVVRPTVTKPSVPKSPALKHFGRMGRGSPMVGTRSR